MIKKTRKIVASLLAVLMAFSSLSVIGSAVQFDEDDNLIVNVTEGTAPTVTINTKFYDSDGNLIPDMGTVTPGDTVQARVFLGNNYYTTGGEIVFRIDSDFFDNSAIIASGNSGVALTVNSANAVATAHGITASAFVNTSITDADNTVVGVILSRTGTDLYVYSATDWLFKFDLTVAATASTDDNGNGQAAADASQLRTEANLTGYANIPYGDSTDNIANALDSYYFTATTAFTNNTITINNSVTFNANGGTFADTTETKDVSGIVGQTYNIPAAPTKSGYTFLGWSLNDVETFDTTATTFTMPKQTGLVYMANWNQNVTIHFANTGDATVADQVVSGGTAWTDKPTVTKAGYRFMGWQTEAGDTLAALPDNYPVATTEKDEYTYTAVWQKYLTITIDPAGGTFSDNTTAAKSYSDSTAASTIYGGNTWNTTDIPTYNVVSYAATGISRPGYALIGWQVNGGSTITTFPTVYPTDDTTYTAVWRARNVNVYYIVDRYAATPADVSTTTGDIVEVALYGADYTAMTYSNSDFTVTSWVDSSTIGSETVRTYTPGGSYTMTSPLVTTNTAGVPQSIYLVASSQQLQTPDTYTVKFYPEGGTWSDNTTEYKQGSFADGAAVSVPGNATLTKTGYVFEGWSPALSNLDANNLVDYYATWSANEYTVKFMNNYSADDTTVYDALTFTFDELPNFPGDPERVGYTFGGWFTDSACTAGNEFEAWADLATADTTASVYAKWIANEYVINYEVNGGTAVDPTQVTVTYGTAIPAEPTTTREGYTFAGWTYTDAEATAYTGTTMPAYNLTATAQWTINQYTITFDTDGGNTIDPITKDYGAAVTAPADPTKEGYTFNTWDNTIPTTMPAADMTIKATWTVESYTINFNSNDGSTVAPITADYGASITAPTDPTKTGYTFGGWYSDAALTTAYTVPATMPDLGDNAAEITVYAKWNVNQYTITFANTGDTTIDAITQDYDTTVTAPADPVWAGHTFTGWDVAVPAKMPAENKTITAQWDVNSYTIVYKPQSGIWTADSSALDRSDVVTYDNTITVPTLTDISRTGYTFAGWTLDAEGNTAFDGTWAQVLANATKVSGNNYKINVYAQWTINQYTITFANTGDSTITPITQDYGTAVTAPADPTKEGYTFGGWDVAVPSTMPAEDVTITASWNINQYTITFESNGGSAVTAITQDYNTAVTAPTAPTKEGYTFGKWYSDSALTTEYTFTTMPAENITLYASWTINQYTITFNTDGGNTIAPITQDYGTSVTAPADPTKEGYTFNGWDVAVPSIMPANDTTVTAQWTVNQYTITFDTDGGSTIAAITQNYGTAVTAPTDPTKTGYTFAGWDATVPTTMPAHNSSIKALWTVNQYVATFTLGTGKTGGAIWADSTTADKPFTVNFGEAITAPTTPTWEGHSFTGWTPAVDTTMPASNMTYEAAWDTESYTVTYQPDGGTWSDSTTANKQQTYVYDTAITALTDITKTGYTFAGWAPTLPTNMPAENLTVTAQWTVNQYTITFGQTGDTTITPITQDYGTAVTAPSDPTKEGYTFAGWDATIPTTMPAENVTINATWTVNQYTITFDTDGGNTIAPITQNFGTSVQAPANPTKEGYTFASWDKTIPTTMPAANTTIKANWTVESYTINFNSNDGSTVAPITADYGTTITAPTDPTKTGYTFGGWYSDAALTTAYTVPATMPDLGDNAAEITVYAKWNVNQYTITFNTNGGSTIAAITQNYNTTVTAPADPTKTGYTFAGWDKTIPATMPAENVTITASWTINQYSIIFDTDGGSEIATITQDYATDVTPPTPPTKTGYTFAGWDKTIPTTMPAVNTNVKALWNVNTYAITFNSNGGSDVAAISQAYGTTVTAPADPTKEGYTFDKWYSDSALTTAYVFSTMPSQSITVYAGWTINQYTISFESNGGSAVTAITQDYNTAVTAPTAPTKTGYTFDKWYSDSALTTEYVFSTMPSQSITVYAGWTVNQYTLTFGNTGDTTIEPITQDYGTPVTAPSDPTKTGYTFAGWDATIPTTMPAESATINATWTVNNYSIIFNSNGGSDVATITQAYGTAITAPADPTRAGYTFAGWTPSVPGNMPANNLTVTAKWTINQYTITFKPNGGSSVASITQDYNTTVTAPTAPTKTGYTFDKWYSDSALTTEYVFSTMPSENIIVYAGWTVNQYTLTFGNTGDTTITPITQDYGTPVTAPSDPTKAGYTFAGWDATIPTTMPAESSTINATWTVNQYTITFDTDGGSTIAAITQDYGTAVTAPSDPTKAGYTFAGWDATIPTEMPANDMTIKASWTANTYTVTFTLGDGAASSAKWADNTVGNKPFDIVYGQAVTAPADPVWEGHGFAGWDTPVPATMPAENITINAQWDKESYVITYDVNGGTAVSPTTSTVVFETAIPTPPTTTREGYTFGGWKYTDAGGTVYTGTTMPAYALTATAQWTINEYKITFYQPDSSTGAPTYAGTTANEYQVVYANYATVLTEYPAAGPTVTNYTFVGWATTAGATASNVDLTTWTVPAANTILYPAFTRNAMALITTTAGADVDIIKDETAPSPITGYIYNAGDKQTKTQIAEKLTATGAGTVKITPTRGKFCGTGTKVELIDSETNEVLEIYYLIVFGDVNGDANSNSADLSITNEMVTGAADNWYIADTVTEASAKRICAAKAADVNGDNSVDSTDVTDIELYAAGRCSYTYNKTAQLYNIA